MSLFERINTGMVSNDGTGDKLKQAGQKINAAFDTLETILEQPISDAQAAAGSANAAAASQAAAETAANGAASSETAALASQSAAAASAAAASSSATTATTQAGTATTQAGIATTQAGNAATSATTATTQAGIATTQAGNASSSASAAAASQTAAATSASNAATSATNAAASETAAAGYVTALTATSTTSLAIGTGTKVFTTQAGKTFNAGTYVTIPSDAAPTTNRMFGQVVSYSGTTLTVNVTDAIGSGTHTDWSIYGRSGPQGIPAAGTGDVVGPASSTTGNIAKFNDTTGKLIADSGKALPTGTIVGTSDAQTLTNKTITSPAITTPTGIVKGDVGLGNVDNTSDATKNAATATLTNKTIDSATNSITGFGSSASGIWVGTDTTKFNTPKNVADATAFVTLTSSTSIATNCNNGVNFFVTLGHNTTFGAPTNAIDGRTYSWLIQQDATGSRTGAWDAAFEFTSTPTLSTTAGKRDLVTAQYHAASGKFIASFRKAS